MRGEEKMTYNSLNVNICTKMEPYCFVERKR